MSTVHVKNIGANTSEKEVRDFFSFCGKITSLSVTKESGAADSTQSASVTFEKETAAKTALLLDNTQLGSSQVQVSPAAGVSDIAGSATGTGSSAAQTSSSTTADEHEIDQEDKPRSRIFAEYLAHGYVISDKAIQNAISLDNKHGVSSRFTSALTNFDNKYKATDKARGIDQSYGISSKADQGWRGINSYFEKALNTPTGQRLASFYTQGEKQVLDIHNEARRLADLKGGKTGSYTENEKSMEKVPGSEKTTCKCGGDTGTCPCAEGKCACSGCSKANSSGGAQTATGASDTVANTSNVQPLGEKTAPA